jgi:cysteine-rich repeat protein
MTYRLMNRLNLIAPAILAGAMLAGCPGPSNPVGHDSGPGNPDTGVPGNDTGVPGNDTGVPGNDTGVPGHDAGGGCGNGTIDTGEDCDGTNLASQTCVTRGRPGGVLSCDSTCRFDESACDPSPCGNGAINTGEDCDGTMLGTGTCVSEGFLSGTLACSPTCTYDTSLCSSCGNGTLQTGEACDGAMLNGQTCMTQGFTGGTLTCSPTCGFVTTACTNSMCGNGAVNTGEDCDGAMLGGHTCSTYGFASGTLTCRADCTANTSACTNCGNAMIDGAEQCDGANLNSQTCATQGFSAGTLSCSTGCTFVTTACTVAACGNGVVDAGETCDDHNTGAGDGCSATCTIEAGFTCTGAPSNCTATCGDNMIHGTEVCDGTNLNGQTCLTQGFASGGTLTCTACHFVTTACSAGPCGNGIVESPEECDDNNHALNDGCDATCHVEARFDLPVRLVGTAGTHGRVEVRFNGVWRDVCDDGNSPSTGANGANFANVVCRQMGYTGTGHTVFTAGGGSDTPVMDDVVCSGAEPNLSQCGFSGWGLENCTGPEALGVDCVPGEGDVRLTGGPNSQSGRMQYFHSGAWGEVCDDIFESGRYGPTIGCQQLGYRSGVNSDAFTAGAGDVFLIDDLQCTGAERRISSCTHTAFGVENCTMPEAQGLVCTEYRDGDTRLVAGTNRANGRIEVLHNNVWATVCDDGLEGLTTGSALPFASVSCRQLGFMNGNTLSSSGVTDGPDPIGMDDVMCVGSETSLLMCPATAWGVHNCSHFEDVGVSCGL